MKLCRTFTTLVVSSVIASAAAFSANHDPNVIIPLLSDSRFTLLQGIAATEATHGPATSAKFEVGSDGRLILSVYNIPEGLGVEPETATLTEVSFDPRAESPQMNVVVFADKAHIARSAAHMTLFRISRMSLAQVLTRAISETGGTPIDVRNPTVRDNRPIADVVMFDAQRAPFTVEVNLVSGNVTRR